MSSKRYRGMVCWQCPRYDRKERRCQDSKTNPKSKADSIAVAELLGLRALCHYNPHRDSLALRMYFPRQSAAPSNRQRPPAHRRSIEIEIEIVEQEG